MSPHASLIDELERDLGLNARLRVIANAGGQRRYIPMPESAPGSRLVGELGLDVTLWLAGRYGGETVVFPSRRSSEKDTRASHLRAAVLDAGLTDPTRSANDIAAEFGVTERHVRDVRAKLRAEAPPDELPLFSHKP